MPIQKTNITDEKLISKIVSSQLAEGQKSELTNLVKEMTGGERVELINLIKEANESAQMTKEEEEKLIAINEKYEKKLDVAAKEESNYVRNEFEKFDKEQYKGEFEELETEIQEMPENSASDSESKANPPLSKEMDRPTVIKKEKHTIRTAIIIAVVVIAVVATLIVLISVL